MAGSQDYAFFVCVLTTTLVSCSLSQNSVHANIFQTLASDPLLGSITR